MTLIVMACSGDQYWPVPECVPLPPNDIAVVSSDGFRWPRPPYNGVIRLLLCLEDEVRNPCGARKVSFNSPDTDPLRSSVIMVDHYNFEFKRYLVPSKAFLCLQLEIPCGCL